MLMFIHIDFYSKKMTPYSLTKVNGLLMETENTLKKNM